jgi:hypothetical protein
MALGSNGSPEDLSASVATFAVGTSSFEQRQRGTSPETHYCTSTLCPPRWKQAVILLLLWLLPVAAGVAAAVAAEVVAVTDAAADHVAATTTSEAGGRA